MKKIKEVYKTIEIEGSSIDVYKLPMDVNGNKRYVVSFEHLGTNAEDQKNIKALSKYRGKWVNGHVFQSVNIKEELKFYLNEVKEYYHNLNKRKVVINVYNAYGRNIGYDYRVVENNRVILSGGVDSSNKNEALNKIEKHLIDRGIKDATELMKEAEHKWLIQLKSTITC